MAPSKRSRRWQVSYFVGALIFIGIPNWLGTAWPLFTTKTIPEWVSERRWPVISEPLAPWLTLGLLIVVTGLFVWSFLRTPTPVRKPTENNERRQLERKNNTAEASKELARLFMGLNREIQSLTVAHEEGMDDPCIREWCKSGQETVEAIRTQIALFGPAESALFNNQRNLPETLPDAFAEGLEGRQVQLGMEIKFFQEISFRVEALLKRQAEAQAAKG